MQLTSRAEVQLRSTKTSVQTSDAKAAHLVCTGCPMVMLVDGQPGLRHHCVVHAYGVVCTHQPGSAWGDQV